MQLSPRSAFARVQAAVCVLAVTVGLAVAPALVSTASAAASPCASAQGILKSAQARHGAATAAAAKAKKALEKAKKARSGKAAKVRKAKKALAVANRAVAATSTLVKIRQAQVRSACAKPAPNPVAAATGKKLSLLGLGNGLPLGDLDAGGLVALLGQLLPGVADQLDPAELASLLAGFNAGPDLDSAAVLSLLTGILDPSDITDLIGGEASPEALTELIEDIIGQLSDLGGGLPIPTEFDPSGLWDTFAGLFGTLSADQLGSLLALITAGLGLDGDALDGDQLIDLIESLVPGISEQFDGDQLEQMLGGINGGGLSASTLANLLGGQFSPAQLQQVLNGTAGQALLGTVIAQVVAQLGTAGGGGLELPGDLSAGSIAGLISTVTNLITGVLGGGSVLPVVCGLIPIPLLCP